MADNVTLPGSGAIIAADEAIDGTLGTVQFQFVKIADGTLGSTNKAIVNASGQMSVVITGATATSATGVQTVGIVGNAAATVDAIMGGAAPTNALWMTGSPSTAPAASLSAKTVSATTALNIKASAGNLYGFAFTNASTSSGFIQFNNTAASTTTAIIISYPIPGSATNAGQVVVPPGQIGMANFSAGIGIYVSTTIGGATSINVSGTVFYK